MKTALNTRTVAWIIAALLLCSLVALALPYFSYGEGETASLLGYLAMPGDYPALEASLAEQLGSFQANDIVGAVLLPFLAAIVLFILIIKFRDNQILMGVSAAWGVWSIINYCTNAVLKLGGGTRTLLLGLFAAVTLFAVVAIAVKTLAARQTQDSTGQAVKQGNALAH